MWTDEQPRTRWVDPAVFRLRRPDLRLGAREQRPDRTDLVAGDRIAVRHTVRTSTAAYTLLLNAPEWLGRRGTGAALRDAVAELRAIDLTYGPNRPESLVSRLRRGEISPESYPPLRDLVDRCGRDARGHGRLVRRLGGARRLRPGWPARRVGGRAGRGPVARRRHPRLRRAHRRRPGGTRPGRTRRPVADRGAPPHRSRPGSWSPRPWSGPTSRSPTPTPPPCTPPGRRDWPGSAPGRTTGCSSPQSAEPRDPTRGVGKQRAETRIGLHGRGNDRGGRSATSARGSRNRGVRAARPDVDLATRRRAGATCSAGDRTGTLSN